MTRLAIGAVIGIAIGLVVGAALGIRAAGTEPTQEIVDVAAEAGVDPLDLLGALNTTGMDAREYLCAADGVLCPEPPKPPPSACGWPICGALGQRIFCIEGIESSHGRFMWNPAGWPPPFYQYHAQGWLGWLPPTAYTWGAVIGNRASEWSAAARMLASGAGSQFYGVASGRC